MFILQRSSDFHLKVRLWEHFSNDLPVEFDLFRKLCTIIFQSPFKKIIISDFLCMTSQIVATKLSFAGITDGSKNELLVGKCTP